jgi:hypothetical protein
MKSKGRKTKELKESYLSAWRSIFAKECHGMSDFQVLLHVESELKKRGYAIGHEGGIAIEKEAR